MGSIFNQPVFKKYGLSDKEEFTESEYKGLLSDYPDIHELNKEKKEYDKLLEEKTSQENTLTSLEEHNNNLPVLTDEKKSIQQSLDQIDIDLQDSSLTYLQEKELLGEKERLEQELASLIEQEQPKDTTDQQQRISESTIKLNDKKIIVNELSNEMELGDLV